MLKAELRGKLGAIENSEDALTSNVFGAIGYIGDVGLLAGFLSQARGAGNTTLPMDLLSSASSFSLHFWPAFKDGTEPDLLVVLRDAGANPISAILIECKYHSGLSRSASDDGEAVEDTEPDKNVHDQLTLYGKHFLRSNFLDSGHRQSALEARSKYLIYLTAHYGPPRDEGIETSREALEKEGLPLLWLSWRDFPAAVDRYDQTCPGLDAGRAELLADVLALIVRRKGLTRFSAIALDLRLGHMNRAPSALKAFAESRSARIGSLCLGRKPIEFSALPLAGVTSVGRVIPKSVKSFTELRLADMPRQAVLPAKAISEGGGRA